MVSTSVILVNYNGGDLNFACIESLLEQPDVEIIVVDNGSTDGSAEGIMQRYGDLVRIVRLQTNVGFARGCNAGVLHSTGHLLLFFNNDAIAEPGMVRTLRSVLEQNPGIGIVGPVVLDARNPEIVQYTGPTIDRWGFTVDETTDQPASTLPPDPIRDCFYISGCALMMPAHHFKTLGGFDDGMFMFCEDVDLCWRVQLLGFRVATVRDAACRHLGGGTATAGRLEGSYHTSNFRITEREKNTFRMMVANLNALNLARYITFHYPFWIVEAIAGALTGRLWVTKAYWRGFLAAMMQLPNTIARRRKVQSGRKVPDESILAKWSPRYEKLRFIRRVGLPRSA